MVATAAPTIQAGAPAADAVRAYGYERANLVGRSGVDLLADPELRLSDEQLADARREGMRFETVHRRQDGTTFPVEVNLVGTDGAEMASAPIMMAIVRDVSARHAVEAALRASEASRWWGRHAMARRPSSCASSSGRTWC